MRDDGLSNRKPSPLVLIASLASVATVLTLAVALIQHDKSGSTAGLCRNIGQLTWSSDSSLGT